MLVGERRQKVEELGWSGDAVGEPTQEHAQERRQVWKTKGRRMVDARDAGWGEGGDEDLRQVSWQRYRLHVGIQQHEGGDSDTGTRVDKGGQSAGMDTLRKWSGWGPPNIARTGGSFERLRPGAPDRLHTEQGEPSLLVTVL